MKTFNKPDPTQDRPMALDLTILDRLQIADPETYTLVKGRLAAAAVLPDDDVLRDIVDEIIWGLSLERGLANAYAEGLVSLAGGGFSRRLPTYVDFVRQAAKTGATLGRLIATFSAAVIAASEALLDPFRRTLTVMLAKGTYTLTAPLEALTGLLAAKDEASAAAYLQLLTATFRQQISYNLSLRMAYLLPKAVSGFAPRRRLAQIQTLTTLVQTDLRLADPFLEGLGKGLDLLDTSALRCFVETAMARYAESADAGFKYLSLSSKVAQDHCAAMQKSVPLAWVKAPLNRYLKARTGRSVAVRPLSELGADAASVSWICSDGIAIYLADENAYFDSAHHNRTLYKDLVRLEAGYFEYGTFDFDLERAADGYPAVARCIDAAAGGGIGSFACDGERFVRSFGRPTLAEDLFSLFEQHRIAHRMQCDYPGLMRQVIPKLHKAFDSCGNSGTCAVLAALYGHLVLGLPLPALAEQWQRELVRQIITRCMAGGQHRRLVESSADLVCRAMELFQELGRLPGMDAEPFLPPFGRRLDWKRVSAANAGSTATLQRLKKVLDKHGLSVYPSDLRRCLDTGQGRIGADDIERLVLARGGDGVAGRAVIQPIFRELEALFESAAEAAGPAPVKNGPSFRYPEWDANLQDYLHQHTHVYEIDAPGAGNGDAYRQTLVKHHGLLSRMRRAFELLKPEGIALLRQWPEGDAFDYRALIDFAIDRRAGLIPTQRLYIKRLKQQRDVAVLLLVDLSRSTANPVKDRPTTVLDVAKEALVLFSEALQVVGDAYAIAGFSGTGRHSVDYIRIKDFTEPPTDIVQTRISALEPRRSTRMGAAVRHAAAQLQGVSSRVRLMIVLSDGFPNDVGYKSDYAIADTCRAVQEARAKGFHVKAIAVNIGSDPRLDDLYGRFHHHVIEDVTELPDKLLRLYSLLTRC
jgi:Mg-chelatase subunit ChlD